MREVLDQWVSGAKENHEALGHRDESTGDECWNSFHPDDIRRMIEDAAQDCAISDSADEQQKSVQELATKLRERVGKVAAVAAALGVDEFQVREAVATAPDEVREALDLEPNQAALARAERWKRDFLNAMTSSPPSRLNDATWQPRVQTLDVGPSDTLLLVTRDQLPGEALGALDRYGHPDTVLMYADELDTAIVLRAGATVDHEALTENRGQFRDAAIELARAWQKLDRLAGQDRLEGDEAAQERGAASMADAMAREVLRLAGVEEPK